MKAEALLFSIPATKLSVVPFLQIAVAMKLLPFLLAMLSPETLTPHFGRGGSKPP
jgi:hypothetical protein